MRPCIEVYYRALCDLIPVITVRKFNVDISKPDNKWLTGFVL